MAETGTNKISQEITVRLFRFNSLSQSSYMNARLSNGTNQNKPELFFYASLGGGYVLSNILSREVCFKAIVVFLLLSLALGYSHKGLAFNMRAIDFLRDWHTST